MTLPTDKRGVTYNLPQDRYLPLESNGRAIGRAIEWFGIRVELAGIWIQKWAAEVRWRRL